MQVDFDALRRELAAESRPQNAGTTDISRLVCAQLHSMRLCYHARQKLPRDLPPEAAPSARLNFSLPTFLHEGMMHLLAAAASARVPVAPFSFAVDSASMQGRRPKQEETRHSTMPVTAKQSGKASQDRHVKIPDLTKAAKASSRF